MQCNFWKPQQSLTAKCIQHFHLNYFQTFSTQVYLFTNSHVYFNIIGKNETRDRNSTVNSDIHHLLELQVEGILITSFIMTKSNAGDTKTWEDELIIQFYNFCTPYTTPTTLQVAENRTAAIQLYSKEFFSNSTHLRKLFVFIWETINCIIEDFFNHFFFFI